MFTLFVVQPITICRSVSSTDGSYNLLMVAAALVVALVLLPPQVNDAPAV